MKKSTVANVHQILVTLPASGLSGAPVVLPLKMVGNRIIQINNDIAVTPTYVYCRITQGGRLVFPVSTNNDIAPLNNGWYMLKSVVQLFVDIPINPDEPIEFEGFCAAAGGAPVGLTIITAGESAESLLLKVLGKLEDLENAIRPPAPIA